MTKLRITVTKEIIEESKYCAGAADSCAIALAVRIVFPNALVSQSFMIPFGRPDGFKGLINRYTYGPENCIDLPKAATEFIKEFDSSTNEERLLMPEISFELNIPEEVVNQINIDELKPLLENHPTLALV